MSSAETFREQNYIHTLENEAPSRCGGKGMDKMRMKAVMKDEFSKWKEATNGLSEGLVSGPETGKRKGKSFQAIEHFYLQAGKRPGEHRLINRVLIYFFFFFISNEKKYEMAHNWLFLRSLSPGINNQMYLQTPTQHWVSLFHLPGIQEPLLMPSKKHLSCTSFKTDV